MGMYSTEADALLVPLCCHLLRVKDAFLCTSVETVVVYTCRPSQSIGALQVHMIKFEFKALRGCSMKGSHNLAVKQKH